MKQTFQIAVVVLIALFFASVDVWAESLVLQPDATDGEDANWYSYPHSSDNYNFGGLICLEITNNGSFQGRGLLKFDLPVELAEKDILNATLSLYAYDTSSSYDNVIYINRVTSLWEELPAWALFTPPSYDTSCQASAVLSVVNYSWVDFDITDMVNFWALNPDDNYGMALVTDNTNYNKNIYSYAFSSDYSNASWRPRLSIEYSSHAAPEPVSFALFGIGAIVAMANERKNRKNRKVL